MGSHRSIHLTGHIVPLTLKKPPVTGRWETDSDGLSCLQLVAEASGKSKAELLTGLLENLQPVLNKRLLLPLRHVPTQTGYAASLTYCLQQDPPLVSLTPVNTPLLSFVSPKW